jgi:LCP family protein required for cell wall assembly
VILGALVVLVAFALTFGYRQLIGMATSNIPQENLLPPEQRHTITTINGAKNVLFIGVDSRPGQNPNEPVRADSIIILHIPDAHDKGYLVSIPRDTYADIPAYNNGAQPYPGGSDKINSAFAYGGQGLTGTAARSKATTLLARTVTRLTGITFDSAAIVDFQGFRDVVNVLGGVDMCVDERTVSIHNGYDKNNNLVSPSYEFDDNNEPTTPRPGITPVVYQKGCHHFAAWQALDYVRQRDVLANNDGDYGRQRHQQQFLKAVFSEVGSTGTLMNIPKLNGVLHTVGEAMTVDDGNIPVADWLFAMRGVRAGNLVTIKTNQGHFTTKTVDDQTYESLDGDSMSLMHAVRDDTVANFLASHPGWES